MNKRELKKELKAIKKELEGIISNIDKIFKPVEIVSSYIEKITEVQEEYSVCTDTDFDEIKEEMIKLIISENEGCCYVEEKLDELQSELDYWQSEVSGRKSEEIQESKD